ncbi:unnamed protein product, partial [marine sediment metagenome]
DERYSEDLFYYLGYEDRSVVAPPEMKAAGPGEWANQVGTGPYMYEEYVVGSHISLVRNPNYWDTWTYEGQEYQLPFIDRIVLPIVPDSATRLASLRTGKIELYLNVPAEQWDTLDRTCPDLLKVDVTGGAGTRVCFRCDIPPFNDVNVRRAMMIGTNFGQHQPIWGASGMPIHWYPTLPGHPAFVPMDELPQDIQTLYDYNPTLAKKMLADAGYPNGFTIDLAVDTGEPKSLDMASLCASQWSEFGVNVNIVTRDPVEHTKVRYG